MVVLDNWQLLNELVTLAPCINEEALHEQGKRVIDQFDDLYGNCFQNVFSVDRRMCPLLADCRQGTLTRNRSCSVLLYKWMAAVLSALQVNAKLKTLRPVT